MSEAAPKKGGLACYLKDGIFFCHIFMHMQLYNALAIITVLAALFGYINYRFTKLPDIIGVMVISLVASLAILCIGLVQPGIFRDATTFIRSIDFYTILIKIMLSFLLFAGAIVLPLSPPRATGRIYSLPFIRRPHIADRSHCSSWHLETRENPLLPGSQNSGRIPL